MDYIEFHIRKDTAERAAFIGAILILFVVAIFASKHIPGCPAVECTEQALSATAPLPPMVVAPEVVAAEPRGPEASGSPIEYVDMVRLQFAPKEVKIPVNGMVVFTNKEPATAHKLYEQKGYFFGPRMNPGESYNVTFNATGTYTILSIMGQKAGMEMKIIVS